MATNSILNANVVREEPSIQININSIEDAKDAVADSARLHQEALARGIGSIELCVVGGLEAQVDRIVAGVFRLKIYFKTVIPPTMPGNVVFMPRRRANFPVPIRQIVMEAPQGEGSPEQLKAFEKSIAPEKIDRRKFNRPPPRKSKTTETQPV